MRLIPAVLLLLSLVAARAAAAGDPIVLGWLELARLGPDRLILRGKLDTGARNSSLNAQDVARFRKDGRLWVRFSVTNNKGRTVKFERPVEGIATIKRAGADAEERYVILLDVCVAQISRRVEVNLTDRSDLNYQLLIGRRFLEGAILVDSSSTFTTKPTCAADAS